jgi:predicted esterase
MSGPEPAPVVFLHGRGQGPESADAVRPAFPGVPLLAPSGGVALRRGRTWFENERIGVARANSVADAETRFLLWCDEGPLRGQAAWLCGFSNGGAFAAHLLMQHPTRFHGAALLSAPLVLPPWPEGALRGKPVLYAHGDAADTVVTSDFYAEAEAYLTGLAGCSPAIRHLSIGHEVTEEVVDALGRWFATVRTAAVGNEEGSAA